MAGMWGGRRAVSGAVSVPGTHAEDGLCSLTLGGPFGAGRPRLAHAAEGVEACGGDTAVVPGVVAFSSSASLRCLAFSVSTRSMPLGLVASRVPLYFAVSDQWHRSLSSPGARRPRSIDNKIKKCTPLLTLRISSSVKIVTM